MIDEKDLTETQFKAYEKILELINNFMQKFVDIINPDDYEDNIPLFLSTCVSCPAMLTASVIEKVESTGLLDRSQILGLFVTKFHESLGIVDNREKGH
jgi:hypothetical protein